MFNEYKYSYYQTLRLDARSTVVDSLNNRISTSDDSQKWRGITLASINQEAIEFARKNWPRFYQDELFNGMPISWEKLFYQYTKKASNFNIAIWQATQEGKILQGMALGKPSKGKNHLTINWLERSYAPSYLAGGVALPILAAAQEYAILLGCERVLIKDAVDPSTYSVYGYTPYDPKSMKGSFLSKELNHG